MMRFGTLAGLVALLWCPMSSADDDNGVMGPWSVYAGEPTALELEGSEIRGVLPDTGWVNALGFEMRPRNSNFDFATSSVTGGIWCLPGSAENFVDIRLDVPHNARIVFFRIWGVDSSADHNLGALLFESCLPNLSAGEPVATLLADLNSSGTFGEFSVTAALPTPQPVTDTRNCTYWARARFPASCPTGAQLVLRKFRVQYSLVPPAP